MHSTMQDTTSLLQTMEYIFRGFYLLLKREVGDPFHSCFRQFHFLFQIALSFGPARRRLGQQRERMKEKV
jgi:hypothetical protein